MSGIKVVKNATEAVSPSSVEQQISSVNFPIQQLFQSLLHEIAIRDSMNMQLQQQVYTQTETLRIFSEEKKQLQIGLATAYKEQKELRESIDMLVQRLKEQSEEDAKRLQTCQGDLEGSRRTIGVLHSTIDDAELKIQACQKDWDNCKQSQDTQKTQFIELQKQLNEANEIRNDQEVNENLFTNELEVQVSSLTATNNTLQQQLQQCQNKLATSEPVNATGEYQSRIQKLESELKLLSTTSQDCLNQRKSLSESYFQLIKVFLDKKRLSVHNSVFRVITVLQYRLMANIEMLGNTLDTKDTKACPRPLWFKVFKPNSVEINEEPVDGVFPPLFDDKLEKLLGEYRGLETDVVTNKKIPRNPWLVGFVDNVKELHLFEKLNTTAQRSRSDYKVLIDITTCMLVITSLQSGFVTMEKKETNAVIENVQGSHFLPKTDERDLLREIKLHVGDVHQTLGDFIADFYFGLGNSLESTIFEETRMIFIDKTRIQDSKENSTFQSQDSVFASGMAVLTFDERKGPGFYPTVFIPNYSQDLEKTPPMIPNSSSTTTTIVTTPTNKMLIDAKKGGYGNKQQWKLIEHRLLKKLESIHSKSELNRVANWLFQKTGWHTLGKPFYDSKHSNWYFPHTKWYMIANINSHSTYDRVYYYLDYISKRLQILSRAK
jgi:hypothetical protein